jgi:hypothetical protein
MSTLATKINEVTQTSCPYEDIVTDICRASVSSMNLGLVADLKFCTGEDYDGCPIFLSKILRKG